MRQKTPQSEEALKRIEREDAERMDEQGKPSNNASVHFTSSEKNAKHEQRAAAAANAVIPRGGSADFLEYCKNAKYEVNAAKHLYLRGVPKKQIAREMGVTVQTISNVVNRFGWHQERRAVDAVSVEIHREASKVNHAAIKHALNIGKTEGSTEKLAEMFRRIDNTNLSRGKMLVDRMLSALEGMTDPDPAKAEKVLNVMLKLNQLQGEVLKNPGKMAPAADAEVPEIEIDDEATAEMERKAQEAIALREQIEKS